MKIKQKSFIFEIEGINHIIDIEFSITKLISIKYDNDIVNFQEHTIASFESFYSFELDNHKYDIKMPWIFNNKFELFIDNTSIDTGNKKEEVILRHDLALSSCLLLGGGIILLLSASEMVGFMWIFYFIGAANILLSTLIFKKIINKITIHASSILLIITGGLFFVMKGVCNPYIILLLMLFYIVFGFKFLACHINLVKNI